MIADRSKSYAHSGIVVPGGRGKKTIKVGNRQITLFGGPKRIYNPHYANDTSAYRPEVWANEAVAILYENMIYGGTVHTDFNDEIASFGDTVHTRKPGGFEGKRKQNDLDDLEDQDVTATGIDVVLNQRVYVSFLLGDKDRSLSFQNLVEIYLREAIMGYGRLIDQAIGCQVYQFLGNAAGGLGQMSKTNAHDYLLDMRENFNDRNVPLNPRWLGLASRSETIMQKTDLFKSAEKIGDAGGALRNALLGRVAGWNTFLEMNTPSVRTVTMDTAAATTLSAAALEGATALSLTSAAGLVVGQYIVVAGDYTPLRILTIATNDITVNRGLNANVANGAAVTAVETALVDQASAVSAGDSHLAASDGYPANWMKPIHMDGTGVPKVGQLVSFRAAGGTVYTPEYGILQVDSVGGDYEILLDRPLVNAVANNDIICLGPAGDYNFAYQRDAVALVNRPLDLPLDGTARAAVGFANNVSLRVVITYDGKKEATRVTVSGLFGVGTLDTVRGGVFLG